MLDELPLLYVSDVADGMEVLRQSMPDVPCLGDLVNYFDATYVLVAVIARAINRPN